MPGRVGLPGPRRPRRSDIAAAAVLLLLVLSICVVGTGVFIQNKLKPTDGRFGVPQYLVFPLCGRDYMLSGQNMTMTQAERDGAPANSAFILEPTIGQIPLVGLFTGCPMNPDGFYDTVIWLHVGGDQYVAYVVQGGP